VGVRREWNGALELDVTDAGDGLFRALAYPALVGRPEPGDTVLLSTDALALGLGTGGYAFVVAVPDRLPEDAEPSGHLVKARYTPMQLTVAGADEQGSPHYDVFARGDVAGMPVVVADLHSALPAVCAGILADRPDARIAYVMTDGGALPIWFSRNVAGLRAAGRLCGTVTTGQAFGGDLETVTLHNGLLAARYILEADVAVVAQGPGNLGTGTPLGFSGIACGEAVNAAAVLDGRPVGALRVSQADERERHRNLSHHSLTAYGLIALATADIPFPDRTGMAESDASFWAEVAHQSAPLARRHRFVTVDPEGLREALLDSPVPLSTMGRGPDADYAAFLASAIAGRHAAKLLGAP
jgi:hypothetical protein